MVELLGTIQIGTVSDTMKRIRQTTQFGPESDKTLNIRRVGDKPNFL